MKENQIWDNIKDEFVDIPKDMESFINEIELVCKKHNLSISHEDGHGSFIIERYDQKNIDWLKDASKNY
ncbi:hypothetical protein [Clostridium sp. HBUAS56010]|uniref:hypothetical protein n=1 Tax=Clostridium sp. HBUAS56010 TaxID=2571127 RepID=UPI0011776526|nr:hypothetical protein [Clostridium sp. HBUAS56010]